jgi:putative transcription factor|tara:strand:- start:16874 stop:17338 length:465 start_codon:yes stop_codon:yes gene_type:complete
VIKINCDLCGKVDENFNRVIVESVELTVCSNCTKFGKFIGPVKKPVAKLKRKEVKIEEGPEVVELLVENFAGIIKKKREAMGFSHKDFAIKLNVKESVIHKLEIGSFIPQLTLAKKLEKILGVKLIEEHQENHQAPSQKGSEGFTLGDFIKVRK